MGKIDTRTSKSYTAVLIENLPSCGNLFSAILSFDNIFILVTNPLSEVDGGVIIIWRTPSIRILTFTLLSCGSTWISVARSFIASWRIKLTSFTIGASSSLAFSGDRSTSSAESSSPEITVMPSIASST